MDKEDEKPLKPMQAKLVRTKRVMFFPAIKNDKAFFNMKKQEVLAKFAFANAKK